MNRLKQQLSPAMVISVIALFVALGGGAYAITRDSVGTAQLKRGAVTTKKLRSGAVTSAKIRNRSLRRTDFRSGTLARAMKTRSEVPSSATEFTYGEARDKAFDVDLMDIGPATIYAKCFTVRDLESETEQTYANVYIRTLDDGVLFRSPLDSAVGKDLLKASTPISKREITSLSVGENSNDASPEPPETFVLAPDRQSTAVVQTPVAVKNGRDTTGVGPFGKGNVCIFMADIIDYTSHK